MGAYDTESRKGKKLMIVNQQLRGSATLRSSSWSKPLSLHSSKAGQGEGLPYENTRQLHYGKAKLPKLGDTGHIQKKEATSSTTGKKNPYGGKPYAALPKVQGGEVKGPAPPAAGPKNKAAILARRSRKLLEERMWQASGESTKKEKDVGVQAVSAYTSRPGQPLSRPIQPTKERRKTISHADISALIRKLLSSSTRKRRIITLRRIAAAVNSIKPNDLDEIVDYIASLPAVDSAMCAGALVAGSMYFAAIKSTYKESSALVSTLANTRAAIILSLEPGAKPWHWPEADRLLMIAHFSGLPIMSNYRTVRNNMLELGASGITCLGRLERQLLLKITVDFTTQLSPNGTFSMARMTHVIKAAERETREFMTVELAKRAAEEEEERELYERERAKYLQQEQERKEKEEMERQAVRAELEMKRKEREQRAKEKADAIEARKLARQEADARVREEALRIEEEERERKRLQMEEEEAMRLELAALEAERSERDAQMKAEQLRLEEEALVAAAEAREAERIAAEEQARMKQQEEEVAKAELEALEAERKAQEERREAEAQLAELEAERKQRQIEEERLAEKLRAEEAERVRKAKVVAAEEEAARVKATAEEAAKKAMEEEVAKAKKAEEAARAKAAQDIGKHKAEEEVSTQGHIGKEAKELVVQSNVDKPQSPSLPQAGTIKPPALVIPNAGTPSTTGTPSTDSNTPVLEGRSSFAKQRAAKMTPHPVKAAAKEASEGGTQGKASAEAGGVSAKSLDLNLGKEDTGDAQNESTAESPSIALSPGRAEMQRQRSREHAPATKTVSPAKPPPPPPETETEAEQPTPSPLGAKDKSPVPSGPQQTALQQPPPAATSPLQQSTTTSVPETYASVVSTKSVSFAAESPQPMRSDLSPPATVAAPTTATATAPMRRTTSEVVSQFHAQLDAQLNQVASEKIRVQAELAEMRAARDRELKEARERSAARRQAEQERIMRERKAIEESLRMQEMQVEEERLASVAARKAEDERRLREAEERTRPSVHVPQSIKPAAPVLLSSTAAKPTDVIVPERIPHSPSDLGIPLPRQGSDASTLSTSTAGEGRGMPLPPTFTGRQLEEVELTRQQSDDPVPPRTFNAAGVVVEEEEDDDYDDDVEEQMRMEDEITKMRKKLAAERAQLQAEMAEKRAALEKARLTTMTQKQSFPTKASSSSLSPKQDSSQLSDSGAVELMQQALQEQRKENERAMALQRKKMVELMRQEKEEMEKRLAKERAQMAEELNAARKSISLGESAVQEQLKQLQVFQEQQMKMVDPIKGALQSPTAAGLVPQFSPGSMSAHGLQHGNHGAVEAATESEIKEYAVYLGMDPEADKDLFYIAEWALNAPLPEGWTEHLDGDQNEFYYNSMTGVSTYEHPLDEQYRAYYRQIKEQRRHGGSLGRPSPPKF